MDNKQRKIKQNDETLNFDFAEWAELAVDDPQAFEARRLDWCQRLIDSAPLRYRRRLSGLLFQINMERRRSANPIDSCMRISRMMWEALDELRGEIHALVDISKRGGHHDAASAITARFDQPARGGAKIIPLRSAEATALAGNR